jgi:hypothetical protein
MALCLHSIGSKAFFFSGDCLKHDKKADIYVFEWFYRGRIPLLTASGRFCMASL